jgi:hypothetical protein
MCNTKEQGGVIQARVRKEGVKVPLVQSLPKLSVASLRDVLSVEEALFYAQSLEKTYADGKFAR